MLAPLTWTFGKVTYHSVQSFRKHLLTRKVMEKGKISNRNSMNQKKNKFTYNNTSFDSCVHLFIQPNLNSGSLKTDKPRTIQRSRIIMFKKELLQKNNYTMAFQGSIKYYKNICYKMTYITLSEVELSTSASISGWWIWSLKFSITLNGSALTASSKLLRNITVLVINC